MELTPDAGLRRLSTDGHKRSVVAVCCGRLLPVSKGYKRPKANTPAVSQICPRDQGLFNLLEIVRTRLKQPHWALDGDS